MVHKTRSEVGVALTLIALGSKIGDEPTVAPELTTKGAAPTIVGVGDSWHPLTPFASVLITYISFCPPAPKLQVLPTIIYPPSVVCRAVGLIPFSSADPP